MALSKKEEQRISARIFSCLSLVVAVVLLALGVLSYKVGASATSEVNAGLVAQKVFFPPAGSPGFEATVYPAVQKYAGKQVKDGVTAKAYSDDYLGVQLKLLGNGKTLSEVAADLAVDPQNPLLQQLQNTMFQIETSRGMLAVAYGASAQAKMMQTAGMVAVVVGAGMLVVGAMQWMRYKQLS